MIATGLAHFDTALGAVGIAWNDRGVACVQLPESNARATLARLARRFPAAREATPPTDVQRAIEAIAASLRGVATDLGGIALDMRGVSDFDRRVYEAARGIPFGRTRSYGEIAAQLGEPQSARDVGTALGRNPFSIVVPCHRVLAAGGKLGGFSARGGVATKLRLLSIEGVQMAGTSPLFGAGS